MYCRIELDPERCSFCEICVRRCPAGAFRIERSEGEIRLLFTAPDRPACARADCEGICPEQALRLVEDEAGAPPAGEQLLARSELLACSYCDRPFVPLLKLRALAQPGRTRHEPIRDLCPECRRKHLVVTFIEQRRLPGQKAEYRSGTDIIRRAGYGPTAGKRGS